MTIIDCCISLKMIKKTLVAFGVVDMRQLLLIRFLEDISFKHAQLIVNTYHMTIFLH